MRIETCYFCSRPCYPSKGITFVRNDAKAFRFCRSKCQKNFKMKRNPRKLAWTKNFRAHHGKELTVDSTLTFAARRNAPVRYNRELVTKTIGAMSIVSSIKAKRERQHYINRMRGNKSRSLADDRELVAKAQHLLPPALRDVNANKKSVAISDKMEDDLEIDGERLAADAAWRGYESGGDGSDDGAEDDEELVARRRRGEKNASALKSSMAKKMRVDEMDIDA